MKLPGFISRILRSKLVGNTAIMTAGNGARLLLGAVTFVIVARAMGNEQFGTFATVVAVAMIVTVFSSLGGDTLVVRRASRNPADFPSALRTSLTFLSITGPILLVVYIVATRIAVGPSATIHLLILVGISDILCQPLNNICAASFLGMGRPIGTAWLNIVFTGVRVLGAILWVAIDTEHTALSWALFYAIGSLFAAGLSLFQVIMMIGRPGGEVRWSEWYNGFHYALQNSFSSSFRQIDRPVIAHLSSLAVVGLYAAAFRIADAASMPVQAIMYATFNKFFQLGEKGTSHSLRFALRILPFAVGAGVVSGIAVAVVAPFAPLLLGPAYEGTRNELLMLSALPALLAFSYVGGDILLGSDQVALRTLILLAMPVVSVAMCFVFVPSYGAMGAVYATLSTNAIAAAVSWSAAIWISRKPAA